MTDDWITVEDAAERLQVSTRQAHRYGQPPLSRIRTRKAGRRMLFHLGDVEELAAELNVEAKPAPRPKTELVPVGEMLTYIRERDQQLSETQERLNRAMLEVGRLQGQLEQRLLPEDADALRQQLQQAEQERDALRQRWARVPLLVRWLFRAKD